MTSSGLQGRCRCRGTDAPTRQLQGAPGGIAVKVQRQRCGKTYLCFSCASGTPCHLCVVSIVACWIWMIYSLELLFVFAVWGFIYKAGPRALCLKKTCPKVLLLTTTAMIREVGVCAASPSRRCFEWPARF
jgi:hypothetical protein